MYFEEWDEDRHICDPFDIPASWSRWTGIDYGYADPFCCLWFARNPSDKYHIYIYREAYASRLREVEQADEILKATGSERISVHVVDPSTFNTRSEQGKPSIAWMYHQRGLRPLVPGMNARKPGWAIMRGCLAWDDEQQIKPRLQIMRGRAPNLVRTLPSMVHDPLDSEDLADKLKSVKTEDHAVDPCRYALVYEAQPEQHQQARQIDFRFAEAS